MQNMCEGHNEKVQDFLREQPTLRLNICLVTEICELAKAYGRFIDSFLVRLECP